MFARKLNLFSNLGLPNLQLKDNELVNKLEFEEVLA